MAQIYVQEDGKQRRFPCTEDYMFQNQGKEKDPYTLVVKDEEEREFFDGLRFITGHRLKVTTKLSPETELLDYKVYFTFDVHETVRRDGHSVYRAFKS